jgi:predicted O-methyltransferase YrrM
MIATSTLQWKHWFANKELTTNWLGDNPVHWFAPLAPWLESPCSVLEIGSYEGRSAIAFLEYLPLCRLTTVDIFIDPDVEARFDRNLAPYGERVTKIKGRAIPIMEKMLDERVEFDVIYLDTGKNRAASFANSAIAWPLLRTGGILIWDDMLWGPERPDHSRPGPGIRLFASMFADCLTVLHDGKQLLARKTDKWPDANRP